MVRITFETQQEHDAFQRLKDNYASHLERIVANTPGSFDDALRKSGANKEEVLELPRMSFGDALEAEDRRQAAEARSSANYSGQGPTVENQEPVFDNATGEEVLQLPVLNFKPASKSASRRVERDEEECLALPSTL